MNKSRTALAVVLAGGIASASPPPADGPYLPPAQIPDGVRILPPPPRRGSASDAANRQIFERTRKLKGGARWRLATADAVNAPLDRYSCALDMVLTPATAPALAHLIDKVSTAEIVDRVKDHYRTPRPYLRDNGPICEARTPHLDGNGDYPSGHAANGWLEALILASLVPDRATPILTRARQYGESRIVCGVHSHSAVESGWLAGSVTFAVLEASPGFRRDMERARSELAAIGPSAPKPDAGRCAAESTMLAERRW